MPSDGAIIFSDLIGKLDAVRVTCERCGHNGRYRLESLIAEHGGDVSVPDWLAELTADCSIKQA
jgi:RNase P subunit RPR2